MANNVADRTTFELAGGRTRRRRRVLIAVAGALLVAATACSSTTGTTGTNNPNGSAAPGGTAGGGSGGTAKAPSLADEYPRDDTIKLNQIQVLGSHNSYHLRTPQALRDKIDETLGSPVSDAWNYEHTPLDVQFSKEGVRQIEIDVHLDPDGRFAVRHALPSLGLPADAPAEMKQPGLKVFHLPEIDFASTCNTFVGCLETVKTWSDANPGHVPIMILVEAKDDQIPDVLKMGFVTSVPFDKAGLDSIDAEIRTVFDEASTITPDQVRGSHATLEEAVLAGGWPTLGASRGKVMFVLDNGDLRDEYADGHPSLAGRAMFSNAKPGEPEAAFVQQSASKPENAATITDLVKKGYVVRVLVDGDPKVARANDLTEATRAIEAGAQWVSTDYAVADPTVSATYQVKLPDGTLARCNPINAPKDCKPTDIELFVSKGN
jgi:hypothetical protein